MFRPAACFQNLGFCSRNFSVTHTKRKFKCLRLRLCKTATITTAISRLCKLYLYAQTFFRHAKIFYHIQNLIMRWNQKFVRKFHFTDLHIQMCPCIFFSTHRQMWYHHIMYTFGQYESKWFSRPKGRETHLQVKWGLEKNRL